MTNGLTITNYHDGILRREIGGKGAGLVLLKKNGLKVPSFEIITCADVIQKSWHTNPNFKKSIVDWCEKILEESSSKTIIIRSSAREEDHYTQSLAGKYISVTINHIDELCDALDKVVQYYQISQRNIKYEVEKGHEGLAIILQEYILGKLSGVCFSIEPVNATSHKAYCEIVEGSAQLLVEGSTQPTRIWFDPVTTQISDIQKSPQLPESVPIEILTQLANGLLKMEWVYRFPVDIEWTWDGQHVWFLQVRPVTAVVPSQELYPKECATSWFFDQRFIEPITPITRTTLIPLIIRKSIEEGLLMRKKPSRAECHWFGGQVYIPHRVYYDLLEGCPYWWLSSDFKLLFDGTCGCTPPRTSLLGIKFWLHAISALFKHRQEAIFVLHRWEQWKRRLEKALGMWSEDRLPNLTPKEWLAEWQRWQELSEEFLQIHRWAILWSNYVFRLGGKCIVRGKEKYYPTLTTQANCLLFRYWFSKDEKLLEEIKNKYGHRTESLDYFAPRWSEWLIGKASDDTNSLINILSIHGKIHDVQKMDFPKQGNKILKLVFKYIHLREDQRFEWEKILFVQKKLLLNSAHRLMTKGIIDSVEQIWFLTWEELIQALLYDASIDKKQILARQHQWCVELAIYKPPFINRTSFTTMCETVFSRTTEQWQGWSVSSGIAKGVVVVTSSPTDIPNIPRPRILVTQSINPGQTWCFSFWDGIILERGSELSHPAIVAREMNIPMICNVNNIVHKLRTGDYIYMDAQQGSIIKLQSKD